MRRTLLLLLAPLLVATPARAAWHGFRLLSGDEGLSQLSVEAIHQDPTGYLWIGTRAGLNRFDGFGFTVYGISEGLPNDQVHALASGPDSTLYIGTEGGLVSWRPERGFRLEAGSPELPDAAVRELAVDGEGQLWLGTPGGLFVLRDGRLHARPLPGSAASPAILALAADGQRVWAATHQGLFGGDRNLNLQPRSLGAGEATVRCLAAGRDGRLLAGLSDGRLLALDGEGHQELGGPLNGPITALAAGSDGTTWAATARDGLVGHGATGRLVVGPAEGLPVQAIRAIAEDADGHPWVGGFGGAAQFVGRAFTNYGIADGLPSPAIRRVHRDHRGRLWVATMDGIARRRDDGRFDSWRVEHGVPGRLVWDLAEDARGRIWLGAHGGLAYVEDDSVHTVLRTTNPVGDLSWGPQGELLFIVEQEGLYRWRDGAAEPFALPAGQSLGRSRMHVEADGTLWLTGRKGLSRWRDGQWATWTVADGLSAEEPYYITGDGEGNVWFSYHSSRGVTRFDGEEFRSWDSGDGLFNDSVYSIGVDHRGQLWFGSARGVDRFDGEQFTNYGTAEGYASQESNSGAFLADADGTLWFGTAAGLSHYDPRQDPDHGRPPRLALEWLRVGDHDPTQRAGGLVPPGHNDLVARVAVLSFSPRNRIDLRYRLVGYDDGWQQLDGQEIRFTNLPSRAFELELQARRYGGEWSRPVRAAFGIQRSLWQQPLVWLGVALGLLTLLGLGFRWHLSRAEAQRRRLEALVAERTHELELSKAEAEQASQLKGVFLANMSHEIRTPMNGIIGMTEILQESPLNHDQREWVSTVQRCGEGLLAILNDILDFSKIEAGRIELDRAPFDPALMVEDVLQLMAPQAEDKGLELCAIIDPRIPATVIGDGHRLRQILVNLVGNALKFTEEGSVCVRLDDMGDREGMARLRLRVSDTGIGIETAELDQLFEPFQQADGSMSRRFGGTGLGLAISRELAQLLGGELVAESSPGQGSTFTAWVRLDRADGEKGRAAAADWRGRRVLVLSRGLATRAALREQLEAMGGHVDVGTGLEGQEDRARAADLILVDHDHPDRGQLAQLQRDSPRPLPHVLLVPWSHRRDDEESTPILRRPVVPGGLERVRLGLEEAAAGNQGPPRAPARGASPLDGLHVLLAEDNQVNQMVAARALDHLGCRVDVVEDGHAAVLAAADTRYDAILMDCHMPGLDGYEATKQIREQEAGGQHTPIIALTASTLEEDRRRCREAGMDAHLAKPFRREDLEQLLLLHGLAAQGPGQLTES